MIGDQRFLIDPARREVPSRDPHRSVEERVPVWLVQIEDNISRGGDEPFPVGNCSGLWCCAAAGLTVVGC
jgi:hypothetical protein